ncbi:MAG: efflux RND transporter periplasmic adaptor subunit [Verrucomicrobia bacterium]|nr:efflux RND transporter periplasmic adaptor subunit [Verrucomicrobiota bacterium]
MKPNVLLLGAALALFLGACSKKPHTAVQENELPPAMVRVQTVEARPHVATEEVTGSVRAKLHSVIEAKSTGRIEQFLVAPGQRVKQGEVLVKLDVREIQAKLDQARAVRDQSENNLKRYTALLANKVTPQAEFDNVQSANRVAKAALAEAETNLGYMTITAPFDGVITRKSADVGDLATPGKALLEIQDPASLRFEADVPEGIIGSAEAGAGMTVRTGTLEMTGTVSEIAPVADAQSRTFLVKLDLPQTPGLRTGQFGRVAVPVSQTSVLRIPVSAVVQRGQMEIVFVIQNGRAQLRLVKTGKRFGNEVELVSGIEAKEVVAVDNAAKLADGQRVEVQSK